jgi:DNA repair photolyase
MKTPLLPVLSATDDLFASAETPVRVLPQVRRRTRNGPVLHSSPFADGQEVMSLNLTQGCAHQCAFCLARAYPTYPGDEVVNLYADTVDRLEAELSHRREKPKAVYISPATDPFPPLAEVQQETARVVEVLARHGVTAWLMTRGFIRPSAFEMLLAHREHVKITLGLTTVDRHLQRLLEPLAAPPALRLRQLVQLRKAGIPMRVAVEPLVPTVTDTRDNLTPLLEALADVGVEHVVTGYLFLRPGIQEHLLHVLGPHGLAEPVLAAFAGGPSLAAGRIDPARYLPKARRQRGYAAMMALAAGLGITVSVSAVTNPDFVPPRPAASLHRRSLWLPHLVETSVRAHSA